MRYDIHGRPTSERFEAAREFLYEAASYTIQGTADDRALPLAIRRYVEARAKLRTPEAT